MYQIIQTAAL